MDKTALLAGMFSSFFFRECVPVGVFSSFWRMLKGFFLENSRLVCPIVSFLLGVFELRSSVSRE